jgi:hypothetical protein
MENNGQQKGVCTVDEAERACCSDKSSPCTNGHVVEEDAEAVHFKRIRLVFTVYGPYSLHALNRRYVDYLSLTREHRHLTSDYGEHLVRVRQCIEHNHR